MRATVVARHRAVCHWLRQFAPQIALHRRSQRHARRAWRVLVGAVLLGLLLSSGGCTARVATQTEKDLEQAKKKKEKPKPPFESFKVFTEPSEKSFADPQEQENQRITRAIKPGHWTGVLVQTKANHFDFGGQLVSMPMDPQLNPLALERSSFRLIESRSVALPKGQPKSAETFFFAPRSGHQTTSMWNQLRSRDHRGEQSPAYVEPLPHMPSYQYYMVVLGRDASRYGYLKLLDSVRAADDSANNADSGYYRVVLPRPNQTLALPMQPLCWTSIAYVVWDDMLPDVLLPDQQRAMLDWLQWGGGLILSGPRTLENLRGSFLEPYLPATAVESAALDAAALADLNEHWTLTDSHGLRKPLQGSSPLPGVKLALEPQGKFIAGTGQLVAERRVGRGRTVATAFRLSDHDVTSWASFDSFFNGCLLRRPQRMFDPVHFQFNLANGANRLDPEVVSNVRYFTRDAKSLVTDEQRPTETARQDVMARVASAQAASGQLGATPGVWDYDEADLAKTLSGVAAWDDFSAISSAARQTLRDAARISVPKREFVVWMLGIYLIVIVPVNWLVFRLLGRVEWAWVAVPVLALCWGAAVIWLAQLDIGFARAELEIAVLEAQSGFPRAHLTRYTALYSSLSSSYNIHFDDPSAVAQPFSVDVQLLQGQGLSTVTLRVVDERQLSDYPVASNSTGMIHSEQMFDMGGSVDWRTSPDEPPSLENNTSLKLMGAAVVRRRLGQGKQTIDESAWLGDLVPGAKVDVVFQPSDEDALAESRDQAALTSRDHPDGELNLRRLVDLAQSHSWLRPGEVRLVAWREGTVKGVSIEPSAGQARRATLIVANLQFPDHGPAVPDVNLRLARPMDDLIIPQSDPRVQP